MRFVLPVVLLAFVPVGRAQEFIGLGVLPGESSSTAIDVSADGTTIIGSSTVGNDAAAPAWRWRRAIGLHLLGAPGDALPVSVSDDGSVVCLERGELGSGEVYRWHEESGSRVIPIIEKSGRTVVSGDGSTVFGTQLPYVGFPATNYVSMRWREDTGSVSITRVASAPDEPVGGGWPNCYRGYSGPCPNWIVAASTHGTRAVGSCQIYFSYVCQGHGNVYCCATLAAWWDELSGSMLPGPSGFQALDASSDLARVLLIDSLSPPSLYRRTGPDTAVLPDLYTFASAGQQNVSPRMSGNGEAAIHRNRVWMAETGTRELAVVLTSAGLNTTGWSNLVASGIGFDGTVLCGVGRNPLGVTEAWYAALTPRTRPCGHADYDNDGDVGTDADIEAFFRCLAGNCCAMCPSDADFDGDRAVGTDEDIAAFFRVLSGMPC